MGPKALLTSRHCAPNLRVGDTIHTYRYASSPRQQWAGWYRVSKLARHAIGEDGLLLMELDQPVGKYTSVCQEVFEPGVEVTHYGAGATDAAAHQRDYQLRAARRRVGGANPYDYVFYGRHGSSGDSGGPYMYDNSVVAVHWGHKIRQKSLRHWAGIWEIDLGTSTWDVATNLQDGWVFGQGIEVAKRRCRPDRSLAWAYGRANRFVRANASGNSIEFGDEYGRSVGTIRLWHATASGRASSRRGFCRIVGNGNTIRFYTRGNDGRSCDDNAGTIFLKGANLTDGLHQPDVSSGSKTVSTPGVRLLRFGGVGKGGADYKYTLRFVPM